MRGSITVFLSMIMVVIMSIMTMTIESARLACVRLYLKQATKHSLESVFADYYVPLFKDYGLMFLDVTYGEEENIVLEKYEKYLSYNMKNSFFYAAKAKNVKLEDVIYATEASGDAVRRQIYEYMKYKLPVDFAGDFLAQFDYISQAGVLKEFFDKIDRVQDELNAVDRVLIEINSLIDTLKVYQENFTSEKLLETILEIEDSFEIYDELTETVREYLLELGDKWLSEMEVPEFVREIIREEIEILLVYSGGEGDVYGIEESKSRILKLKSLLEQGGDIKAEDVAELFDIEIKLNVGEKVVEGFAGVDFNELLETFSDAGLYGLICPDYLDISDKTIDPFYNRNYARLVGSHTELLEKSFIDEVLENICFAEYAVSMFSDYCNQEDDRPLAYETEYIIGGFYSEKDNIKATIKELIGVREVLNLFHLMCDTQKKEEAYAVAISLAGAGGSVAIKVVQYLIMAVWALGESLLDVRVLMSGGGIPVIKKTSDWRLGLQNIGDVFSIISTVDASNKPQAGAWEYSDYLRLVLFITEKDEQAFRVMDLIEEDIQNKYYSEFYFNNCAYSMEITGDFYLEPLFGDLAQFIPKTNLSCKYSY